MISAYMMGAERVIAIDRFRNAWKWQENTSKLLTTKEVSAGDDLMNDGWTGPDCCLDAVGLEAHGVGLKTL